MYKIIGADNAEYGPVAAEKIREWIKEGRANSQTKVQPEGSAEWKSLSECAEFADVLAVTSAAPPPLPTVPLVRSNMSGMAIASLVLAALGLVTFGITSLVGLVLGIVALVKINRSRGALRGNGLALAGTILSGFLILILPIFAAMLLPALARAKARAQSIICINNMKQLGLGGMMYASDNKDQFPSADTWCDMLGKYIAGGKAFQCPAGDPSQRCHYAFNARLSGVQTKNVSLPAQTVLLFEIDGGWNVSGGPELALRRPRHRNMIGLVFADGHCEMARQARLRSLRWDP
jgi:prepilin-type processing-associated H-X9-DG protein